MTTSTTATTGTTAEHHRARRDRVRTALAEHDVDALLVTHLIDVRWLTGLVSSHAAVLIAQDEDDDRLWTDGRYEGLAAGRGLDLSLKPWADELPDLVAPDRLGIQAEHVSVRDHARLRESLDGAPTQTTRIVAVARRVKDAPELDAITRACALTDRGWQWLVQHVRPGMTERDLARDLVRHLEDLGAEGPAFDPIVAAGPNSAVPHHQPTDRELRPGDLLKVDFGAKVDGYASDCTRMLALGEPDARLRDIHAAVQTAQAAGVDAVRVGASAQDVHDVSVGWLEALDLGPTIHGVGHGLGLEIHETPILSSEPTATLADGFVITVEPGVYLAGIGGVRIEDTIAVTSDGPRRLTSSARDLVVL